MTIGKILVPLSGTDRDEIAVALAIEAAAPFNSHIAGLFVRPDPTLSIPLAGAPMSGDAVASIVDGQTRYEDEKSARARATLAALCAREGVTFTETPKRGAMPTYSFRDVQGNAERIVVHEAALSDLVAFGPIRWAESIETGREFLDVLRSAQRPVLVANSMPNGRLRKIAIGWDGSAAAARAVEAAMPFLKGAERVTVAEIHKPGHAPAKTDEILEHLVRHDVRAELRSVEGKGAVADILLGECTGSDMLVAGGYGHDHLWETFFGGVTQRLLSKCNIPVLLVH